MDKYPFFGTIITAIACRDGVVLCSDCKSSHDPRRGGQLPELPEFQKIGPVGKMVGTPKRYLAVAGAAGFGGIYTANGEYATTLDRVEDILCDVEPKRMTLAVADLGPTIAAEIGRAFESSPTQPPRGQRLLQLPVFWAHGGELRSRCIQVIPDDGGLRIENIAIDRAWFGYATPLAFGADRAVRLLAERSDPSLAEYYEDPGLQPFLIGPGASPASYRRAVDTKLDEACHVALSLVGISAEIYAKWGHPDLLGSRVNLGLLDPKKGFRWLDSKRPPIRG